jgi:four helix bundle protein
LVVSYGVNSSDFKRRTQRFAVRIIQLTQVLPKTGVGYVVGGQLLRAGTSVGANYRSACCARSHADFIAKMGIVHEECDESLYWMELLILAGIVKSDQIDSLMSEAREILALVIASLKTARSKK